MIVAIRLWWVLALCACGSASSSTEPAPDPKPEPKPVPQKMDEALASIVATCARCDGAVEVRRKGKPYWEPIAMGGTFRDGDWIRTGAGGAARVRFVSGGHLDLDEKTTLFVEADGGQRRHGEKVAAVHVAMQSGAAWGELDGSSDAPIRLRTSDGDVRIAGANGAASEFRIQSTTAGDGAVDVSVSKGSLVVKTGSGERKLEAAKRPEPPPVDRKPIYRPRPKPIAKIGFPQSVSPRIDARLECPAGSRIPLQWNAVTGASKYRVVVAKDMSFRTVVLSKELTATQIAFAPRGPGTYVWRVAARNARGYGEFGFARRIFCN